MLILHPRGAGIVCQLLLLWVLPIGLAFAAGPPGVDQTAMRAAVDPATGQVDVTEGDARVLRYNYRTVEPPEGYLEEVHANARKYARARSNYIHPMYCPTGKTLTKDWSKDHPHHRGIYRAWPEVQYKGELADLHALQRVFARPTGKIKLRSESDFAEIEAENQWMWEDKTPIVREVATIRAWKAGEHGRYVDLKFEFTALDDDVTLARRGTKNYGGLNIRLAPIANLKLIHHADPSDASPRRAWQLATGVWSEAERPAMLSAIESVTNPQYPGDYVQYPPLPWFQPTFPRAGTRYPLPKGKPLTLRYRLWVHPGGSPDQAQHIEQWNLYNASDTKESL